jgi:hypothetical protein
MTILSFTIAVTNGMYIHSPVQTLRHLTYPSKKSEEADRGRHFVRCHRLQDRRKLYRVSAVAQKLFYVYRELTCGQVKVKEVEKIGDTLVLRGNV